MTANRIRLGLLIAAGQIALGAHAATIWNGPSIEFDKVGFSDWTAPENQDRLTSKVWITRQDLQGLYNAATESSYSAVSPEGTLWAVGTTAELGSLTFDTWVNTVGPTSPIGGPNNMPGVDLVVHLVEEDIFLDLRFKDWGVGTGAGGSFSYVRSTPAVPEPAGAAIAAIAGGLSIGIRRGRRIPVANR